MDIYTYWDGRQYTGAVQIINGKPADASGQPLFIKKEGINPHGGISTPIIDDTNKAMLAKAAAENPARPSWYDQLYDRTMGTIAGSAGMSYPSYQTNTAATTPSIGDRTMSTIAGVANSNYNPTPMPEQDYGKRYAQQMAKAYPESAPRGFWGDLAYRHGATSDWAGAPEMQMKNAEIWAEQQIEAQKAQRAAQQMAAKYNAQNNYGEESADFDANWGYKMGYMGDGNMMPGGPTSTTFVPDENTGFINSIKSGYNTLKNFIGDFDSPTKGVCTLPGGTSTQQLDRAACDAAGGTFNSPQIIMDEALKSDHWTDEGMIGFLKTGGKQLAHVLQSAMNDAQINDNKMQKAGLNWTPDKIAWIDKYGINNLPGTQFRDDIGGDTKATAVGRDTTGYVQEGLLSPDELQLRYPDRYRENAEANKNIFDAATKAAEGRDVTGVTGILPPSFMESEKARIAALQQGTDARFDRRMGDDRMAAASVWADRAIDEQEASIWADKAIDAEEQRIAGDWANQQIDKQERMAAIQAGIDADAGRTTQENYELAAGVTVDTIADRLTEITSPEFYRNNQNDAFVDSVLEGNGFLGTALEYFGLIDGKGRFEGSEQTELNEEESNDSIAKIAELAKLTEQVNAEVTNVKDLTKRVDKEVSGLLTKDGGTTDGSSTPSSLLNVPDAANLNIDLLNTTSTSTDGFTMDRLKNPFSKDNKAWWLEKRKGDIPGNNRAVEFFNALAYIGTPLKYRPAQTPSESLQDRKIQHMNNMMDYSASVASSAASANQNTFTKLKAAVPSQEAIAKSIEGEFYGVKGFFEKGSETDRKIQARAGEIREKMLQMASEGIYPTKQKVYDNEEAERKRIEAEQKRKEEEEKKKNPKPAKSTSWWSNIPGIS